MKLVINDEPVTLDGTPGLVEVLQQLSRHQPGIALAVNQRIIPRDGWADYPLREGDELVIFQTIAGG